MSKTRRGGTRAPGEGAAPGPGAAPGAAGGGAGNGDPASRRASPDALPEEAAQNLRRILAARGMSGAELARRMGVTQATVSRWLTRDQGMPFGTLQRLAEVLEVPYSAILVPGAPPEGDTLGLLEQQLGLVGPEGSAVSRRDVLEAVAALREDVARLAGAVEGVGALLERHDQRVGRLEGQWERARQRLERLRRQERTVPLYHEKHRGDPRRGEDDPLAAVATASTAVPAGAERTVGPRGFALWVETDSVAGLGVRRGDVVFCNPDAPYEDGSLCVVGCPSPEPTGETRPRPAWPLGLNLRQLAFGAGGAVQARKVPAGEPERAYREVDFVVLGPVVLLVTARRLPEGRAAPPGGPGEGGQGRETVDPDTGERIRWADGNPVGTRKAQPPTRRR